MDSVSTKVSFTSDLGRCDKGLMGLGQEGLMVATHEQVKNSNLEVGFVCANGAGGSQLGGDTNLDSIEEFSSSPHRNVIVCSRGRSKAGLSASLCADSFAEADSLSGRGFSPFHTVTRKSFLPLRKIVGIGKGK